METLMSAVAPRPPAPVKRTPEVDFRSGAVLEQLSAQVLELVQLEQGEFGDQTALEVHTAKDYIFNMLGLVQKVDHRLPVANEYLLLSGGAREGVLDLNPEDLGDYARGADFDLDFTLLVPALKLHDRNQPVTLDMRQSGPCHSWLSLRLCDPSTLARWNLCCQEEEAGPEEGGASPGEEGEEPPGPASIPSLQPAGSLDGSYFSPLLVADWFWGVVGRAVAELRRSPQRGTPVPERVERNGPLTTLILTAGRSRVLYDLLPVVSFRGWPAVAQGWLTANHFWDGKITEEEAISGFYLLPCCAPLGGRPDREWRLAFSRSEVQLKKCVPPPMAQAFQAAKAVIARLLSRPPPRRAQPLPPAHAALLGLRPAAPRLPGRGRARVARPPAPGAAGRPGALRPGQALPQLLPAAVQHAGAPVGRRRPAGGPEAGAPALGPRRAPAGGRGPGAAGRPAQEGGGRQQRPRPLAGPVPRRRPRPPGRPAGPAAPAAGHREPRQVHLRLPQPRRRHAPALPHRRQVLLTRGGDEARNVLRKRLMPQSLEAGAL